jgi:hypothetical protein
MQMHRQQFHEVIRTIHRAVDPRPRSPQHPTFAVAEIDDQQLRLSPINANLTAVLHALAFLGLDLGADPDSAAIDLSHDVLSGHLLTRRQSTVTEPQQVTGPCRQDLGAQLPDHTVDGLLIKGQPLVAEFVAGQLDRREQGGQTAHLAVQCRCGPLADAQGGQLGIGTGSLTAPTPTRAGPGGRVDRGDPVRQSAQEPESQPPRLRRSS